MGSVAADWMAQKLLVSLMGIMKKKHQEYRGFKKRECIECGKKLDPQSTRYTGSHRIYCSRCKPIFYVKRSWQPLASGTISKIFTVDGQGTPSFSKWER